MSEPVGRYFLWQGRVLYIGRGGRSALHRHHMLQIGVSLDRPIRIRTAAAEPYAALQGVIVDADQPHQVVATSRRPVLFLWVDPEDHAARRLRAAYGRGPDPAPIPEEVLAGLCAELEQFPLQEARCAVAREVEHTILRTLDPGAATPSIDDRVLEVMRRLRAHRSASFPTVDELAAAVFLSPSRLMHLFREQTGLPMRRYGLWQRLLLALRYLADATPITQAAHAAGFSDAAHLTRTFRAMFGVTPSDLFKNSRFIQATACYDA